MPTDLYMPFKSTRKNKKYAVYVKKNGKKTLIHFGDKRYQHFRDKIGKYTHLEHNDSNRRRSWLARHGVSDKTSKNTAVYWAAKVLW